MWPFNKKTEAASVASDNRPSRGTAREVARVVQRMFKAGESDRLTSGWSSSPMTADAIVTRNRDTLVARSREQIINNDHAKAYARLCRQNIVGPNGVMLQSQVLTADGKLDKEVINAIELAWKKWRCRENCDVTGQQSFDSFEKGSINSAASDGEYIFRKIYGRDAGPWGFSLQVIDSIRLPVGYSERNLNGGSNFIRQGIEYNRFGRPLAYHFTALDESDDFYVGYAGKRYTRVPYKEVIHGFVRDMVGQKRGLPWLATALPRLRHLAGFEEAMIVNARIGASKMAWMKFAPGFGPEYDEANPPEVDIEPGTMGILPEGADIADWNPQMPSENTQFLKYILRSIASGLGVPYNEFASDLEGVNFSSIRQGTLDSREHWKEMQEWLIEGLHQRVFDAWLEYSLLAGRIKTANGRALTPDNLDKYRCATWQPRRWQWIDPRADVDGAVTSKNNFLKSPGEIIREQGSDPSAVWIETARDMRAQVDALTAEGFDEKDALDLVKLAMGQPTPKPVPDQPPPKAAA